MGDSPLNLLKKVNKHPSMAYVCQFEPIPSIVKGGSNFSTFGPGEPPRGHPTKQPSTTILRVINMMIEGE
jgi:hypothetical protein